MTSTLTTKLSDKASARWAALFIVAFTMMAAYYVNDVMAPLKGMLESDLRWTSGEFGMFTGAYSFLNVFLLMLIWGGLILDKFGIRFTGILAAVLMVVGTGAEYYAITQISGDGATILGSRPDVFIASAGYAVFGVGAEVAGITVTKIIAKWFKGKEMALAMGVQVALARIGSQAAYAAALPVAKQFGLSMPLFIGALLLVGGLVAFLAFSLMDRKLDRQVAQTQTDDEEEKFSFKDVVAVVKNPGFWLIALLCVLFYSCVFPFQKYATEIMMSRYGVSENVAGLVAGLPALGALFLTPVFGGMIDLFLFSYLDKMLQNGHSVRLFLFDTDDEEFRGRIDDLQVRYPEQTMIVWFAGVEDLVTEEKDGLLIMSHLSYTKLSEDEAVMRELSSLLVIRRNKNTGDKNEGLEN